MLKPDLSQWIGRTETQHDALTPNTLGMLNATLDEHDPFALKNGVEMPPLAHWCAFSPKSRMKDIAADGHAKLGGFLPPVGLERRMWAGGAIEFHSPLHLGATISRISTIESIKERQGSSGAMITVVIRHELFEETVKCVTEHHNIVYLDIPEQFTPPAKQQIFDDPEFRESVEASEPCLFRFSAVTFNAHRIHYDLAYAQQVEKYPGLVVHGPLQATWMMRAAIKRAARRPSSFNYRGVHPMFHFDDIHIFGKSTDDGMTLCTGVPESHQGMQAKITWEDEQ